MADVLDEARCEAEVGHGGLEIVAGEERLAEGAESQQRGEADRERAARHRKRGPLLLAVRMAALDEGDAPREDEGEQEQDEADDAGGREDDGERVAHELVHHAARTADDGLDIVEDLVLEEHEVLDGEDDAQREDGETPDDRGSDVGKQRDQELEGEPDGEREQEDGDDRGEERRSRRDFEHDLEEEQRDRDDEVLDAPSPDGFAVVDGIPGHGDAFLLGNRCNG